MFSYRDGAHVWLAKSDSVSCPFHLLNRYASAANLDLSLCLPFFRSLHFHKVTSSYSWCPTGIRYTRTREIVLQAFAELGFPKHLFGLHSLRAGGASAAANAGVSDRLSKEGDIGVCGIAVLVNFSCGISVILILNCVIAVFSKTCGMRYFWPFGQRLWFPTLFWFDWFLIVWETVETS